jgi:hypothetical protein
MLFKKMNSKVYNKDFMDFLNKSELESCLSLKQKASEL